MQTDVMPLHVGRLYMPITFVEAKGAPRWNVIHCNSATHLCRTNNSRWPALSAVVCLQEKQY